MNKRIIQIFCFVVLFCMVGCGSSSVPDRDALVTQRATVTKVYEESMEIRVEKGELMVMPTSWLEGKAEPKEGLILEITSTNMVLYVRPSRFAKIISVEVVGFEEPEDKNGLTSALDDNGELPKEGSLCGFRYQIGTYEGYDPKFKDWGYYCYEHDERAPLVLELCSGEHSTGGYLIRVADLEADEEGNLCVIVEETAPEPGDTVTEAFTYPKVTLLIYEKKPASVTVKTTGGAELPFLGSMLPKDEEEVAWQGKPGLRNIKRNQKSAEWKHHGRTQFQRSFAPAERQAPSSRRHPGNSLGASRCHGRGDLLVLSAFLFVRCLL